MDFSNLFWLKNSIRLTAMSQYKSAMATQFNTETINKINWEGRKKIVTHAYEKIPFYRSFYDKMGFHPSMLKMPEDWENVPILEKWMVRENKERMLEPGAPSNEIGTSTTGGSTGIPLSIYTDKRFKFEILGWRAFFWWGINPGDNVGIAHRRVPTRSIDKMKKQLLWWPTKRIYLSATSMSDDDIKAFVEQINRKKIVWLQGYVGTLEKVADYVIKHNIQIESLRMIWSTSAPLMKNVRTKMEKAFGCKVMNQYGCCEVPNIAIQCPHSPHLHVNSDFVHIDVVDANGNNKTGEEGDILVTNLTSFHFPLIKYRLGDKGTLLAECCQCGVKLPLLKEIKGRISDAIYTPNGLCVDGSFLTTIFDHHSDFIDQFQIRQFKDYSITIYVKIKNNNKDTKHILMDVQKKLEETIRFQIPVKIEIVNKIKDDNGKIRYILSDIALEKVAQRQ